MSLPLLTIDLGKVEANARVVSGACASQGISVTGVVKSALGSPEVARAMLAGGASGLADSRLENLSRLRDALPGARRLMLRLPAPSRAEETALLADASLVSEPDTLKALDRAAARQGVRHGIILMVDLGDLREGLMPEDVAAAADLVLNLPNLVLEGVGANFGCLRGVLPSPENLGILCSIAGDIRRRRGVELPLVSGGNTFCLPLLESGLMPAGVNHLRVGAAIMLAAAPTPPGLKALLSADACVLSAEIIELRRKEPARGERRGRDAFGRAPAEDGGGGLRALLALGRQDAAPEDLFPRDGRIRVLGASSDHLALGLDACAGDYRLGDAVEFTMEYGAFLAAMTSPFVHKEYITGSAP